MVRKGFTPEQIINRLREAETHISQGISIAPHLDDFTTRDDLSEWYHRQAVTVNSQARRDYNRTDGEREHSP